MNTVFPLLFSLRLSNGFGMHDFGSTIIKKSIPLIEKHSIKYNIDESHNHVHSAEVAKYCLQILKCEKNIDLEGKKIALLGSLFHDTIDSKYIKGQNTDLILKNLLEKVVPQEEEIIKNVILFSKYISYSKTVEKYKDGSLQFILPEPLQNFEDLQAYHVMRNADLLSSYNLRRSLIYRSHKNKTKDAELLTQEMSTLYFSRMHLLRKSHILSLENPYCDVASRIMEKMALKRIINYQQWNKETKNHLSYPDLLEYFEVVF
jgi:hypothetical protein